MAKKAAVEVTFQHPKSLIDRQLLEALAQESAQSISRHTQAGLNADGEQMRPLQMNYARDYHGGDRTRRLTRSGKMLLSARIRYKRREATIVWVSPYAAFHQRDVNWIGLNALEQKEVERKVQSRWQPQWNKNLRKKTRRRAN